jgi:predicted ester cyclase
MEAADYKGLVEDFDALLNTQQLDRLDTLCTPDMINHSLAPSRPQGLEGTLEFLRSAGRAFTSDHWKSVTVLADGEFVVQFGERGGVWAGGPFLGVELPAGPYSRSFAAMYRIADGRIAERWAVRDDLAMMRQLGATINGVES